jgi:hypothetical protein
VIERAQGHRALHHRTALTMQQVTASRTVSDHASRLLYVCLRDAYVVSEPGSWVVPACAALENKSLARKRVSRFYLTMRILLQRFITES